MAAATQTPPDIVEALEFSAIGVLQMTDAQFFTGDNKRGPVFLGTPARPTQLTKTGGTTEHSTPGSSHIRYELQLLHRGIVFKVYVRPAAADPVLNRAALARGIRSYIRGYIGGTTFTHDEPAIQPQAPQQT